MERCMGVCASGREGLGTPPAPPAEEALTAEHWGQTPLPPPSPPPPPPLSSSLLTSLLLSHLLYLSLSLQPFIRCCCTHIDPNSANTLCSLTLFLHVIMSICVFFCTIFPSPPLLLLKMPLSFLFPWLSLSIRYSAPSSKSWDCSFRVCPPVEQH